MGGEGVLNCSLVAIAVGALLGHLGAGPDLVLHVCDLQLKVGFDAVGSSQGFLK